MFSKDQQVNREKMVLLDVEKKARITHQPLRKVFFKNRKAASFLKKWNMTQHLHT